MTGQSQPWTPVLLSLAVCKRFFFKGAVGWGLYRGDCFHWKGLETSDLVKKGIYGKRIARGVFTKKYHVTQTVFPRIQVP